MKALSGTTRADRVAVAELDLPPLEEAPPIPVWMAGEHARSEWVRMARVLVSARVLTEGNLHQLAQLCNLHGELVELWEAKRDLTAQKGGYWPGPPVKLLAEYRQLCMDFSLPPAARSKLKAANTVGVPKTNAFARQTERVPLHRVGT